MIIIQLTMMGAIQIVLLKTCLIVPHFTLTEHLIVFLHVETQFFNLESLKDAMTGTLVLGMDALLLAL